MKCVCGYETEEGQNFCPKCGKEITRQSETATGSAAKLTEKEILDSEEMKILIGKFYPAYRKAFDKKVSFNWSAFLFGWWNLWRGMFVYPLCYSLVVLLIILLCVLLCFGLSVDMNDPALKYVGYSINIVSGIIYGFLANRLYKMHVLKVYEKAMKYEPEKRIKYMQKQRMNLALNVILCYIALAVISGVLSYLIANN